jgi:large subunit ribosomal protein L25
MLEKGLRVRGTGEGQKVKGHKWERQMPAKLEARRKAMEGMPLLIRKWHQVSFLVLLFFRFFDFFLW